MPAFQEQDFDRLAARVVDGFMGGEKLADAAAVAAMEHELSPDQIERLVETANTAAFLRLMEQQRASAAGSSPDMTREFDPIDARQIIESIMGRIQPPGGCVATHPEPDGDEGPLLDETGEGGSTEATAPKEPPIDDDNDGPFPKGQRQKAKEDEGRRPKKPPARAAEKDEAKEAMFRRLRLEKLAGILEDQLLQAELCFGEAAERLDHVFRLAHGAPSIDAFEKDALALHGDEIGGAILNEILRQHGRPLLSISGLRHKHAALQDKHVVEENRATREFDTLVKIAREARRLAAGIEHLRAQCS